MSVEELGEYCCCFTGHRPAKLRHTESAVCAALEREIACAIRLGFDTFISGMAQGVDIWAAELVLQYKQKGYPIRLICACPYEGFEHSWTSEWRNRYRSILSAADAVYYICPAFHRGCFQRRNEWMVDRCERLIAVYNGEPGGTKNTINYAVHRNMTVIFAI